MNRFEINERISRIRYKKGYVSVDRLNELMVQAQKEAYMDAQSEYDPYFWASKLHFHITGRPFYNFPYTFGYLFSLGIYAYAKEKGGGFEENYIALLQDTGRMTVEELAKKHLQADLIKAGILGVLYGTVYRRREHVSQPLEFVRLTHIRYNG